MDKLVYNSHFFLTDPPRPPFLKVAAATTSTILLQWDADEEKNAPVSGVYAESINHLIITLFKYTLIIISIL